MIFARKMTEKYTITEKILSRIFKGGGHVFPSCPCLLHHMQLSVSALDWSGRSAFPQLYL